MNLKGLRGMSRSKSRGELLPWLSAKQDCREKRFLQIGNSLLLDKRWQSLTHGAKCLYICMAMEAGGKRYFTFPESASRKYGLKHSSFWNYVSELEERQFIERSSMKNLRKDNEYKFSLGWRIQVNDFRYPESG